MYKVFEALPEDLRQKAYDAFEQNRSSDGPPGETAVVSVTGFYPEHKSAGILQEMCPIGAINYVLHDGRCERVWLIANFKEGFKEAGLLALVEDKDATEFMTDFDTDKISREELAAAMGAKSHV